MSIQFEISEKNIEIPEENVIISKFKVGSIIEYNNNGTWIPAEIIKIHNNFEDQIDYEMKVALTIPYYTILFPNNKFNTNIIRNSCNCNGFLIPQRIIRTNHSQIRIKEIDEAGIIDHFFALFN
tara:strand:- start:247 stop:618 length:372 start_codon:yes stop_codon:yes gene_type:complete